MRVSPENNQGQKPVLSVLSNPTPTGAAYIQESVSFSVFEANLMKYFSASTICAFKCVIFQTLPTRAQEIGR